MTLIFTNWRVIFYPFWEEHDQFKTKRKSIASRRNVCSLDATDETWNTKTDPIEKKTFREFKTKTKQNKKNPKKIESKHKLNLWCWSICRVVEESLLADPRPVILRTRLTVCGSKATVAGIYEKGERERRRGWWRVSMATQHLGPALPRRIFSFPFFFFLSFILFLFTFFFIPFLAREVISSRLIVASDVLVQTTSTKEMEIEQELGIT